MALRVLTTDERQSLQGFQGHIDNTYWAIRNYASFWGINDGAGTNSEATRIKWAKDRILSVPINLGDHTDPLAPLQFVKLSKGMQVDLNPAPQTPAVIVAGLLAANKYEELASLYFDLLGESINMSAGGN